MKVITDQIPFQEQLKVIAKSQNKDYQAVLHEAESCLEELFTEQNPIANMVTLKGFDYMMSKAYEDKIDVDDQQIKWLTKLMRHHSVAFILTHKTYLDTVVLINTLVQYGMPIPYFFGGINLAMPGIKELEKNSGLIFLRRSFKDDPVYKLCLRSYISHLIEQGDHLTWNIEGTRSRTGKIVYPQMGILKYIMEAEQQSSRDIKYIPVSIVYDLIPDVQEMTEEGKGFEKKGETLKAFFKYMQKLRYHHGRAAIRFGEPVNVSAYKNAIIPDIQEDSYADKNTLPRFAFELLYKANRITPVTTISLICNVLLNNFALTKREIEFNVVKLMNYIEQRKDDVLLDRGNTISVTVQKALNLLQSAHIISKSKAGRKMQYSLVPSQYLSATYYANMSSGHLYHRAFIEMALIKVSEDNSSDRILHFWEEIMHLRNMFKFEFFYSNKPQFSAEIEAELELFDKNWRKIISNPEDDIKALLKRQELFVSKGMLLIHLEANKVVCHALASWDSEDDFVDDEFINLCLFKGKELHWQSRITRLDSVSKPFLVSALRLAKNSNFTPVNKYVDHKRLNKWMQLLDELIDRLYVLQQMEVKANSKSFEDHQKVKKKDVVPGTDIERFSTVHDNEEDGSHIAAFFDLDRTLIDDFSAKKFVQSRVFSGKSTGKELLAQFATILLYTIGNRDFEILTRLSAMGIKGVKEKEFAELGKEVYKKHLKQTIYPESQKLIESHLKKGHRVVIISAATMYQIKPIAKALDVKDIYCTEMEVINGKFTGNITEMCWGEGKANAGRKFAKENDIDLAKSYFYTDSFDDYPLLDIVGNPYATNPDERLSQMAFENDWTILRFKNAKKQPVVNGFRTGLAAASIYPSFFMGVAKGLMSMSKQEAANTMFSSIGDLGSKLAGLQISVKGKDNLEDYRPAVFCFNHQSSTDFFIILKLLRHDITGIAKKELEYSLIGPVFKAFGAIFIDRSNKEKAIKSLTKAAEVLKSGTSVAIAPEGTRSGSKKLGKFKKGAFHLAMKAGVPIVPIVIKNAYMAMPKGISVFKPTHIEVVVLDPVDTSEWKAKHIDKYVKEVKNMFQKELDT